MRKMRWMALGLGVVTAASVQGQITSVTWSALNSNGLGEADGSELVIGSLLRIGTFTLSEAQIQLLGTDLNALNAGFIEYGTALIGDDVGVAAHWNKQTVRSTDALGINGDKIYFWAFNAATIGSATEHGIFNSTDSTWFFPSDSAIPNVRTIDLEQVDNIVLGSFGTGLSASTSALLFNLVAVPEPSAAAMVFSLLCCAGAVTYRHRKSR